MIEHPIKPVAGAEALAAEARRVAAAILEGALSHLRDPERADRERTVHESRKRIKELRSLLRLLAPSLADVEGEAVRPRENEALRSAADGMGAARDAAVMIQTLDRLREAGGMSGETAEAIRAELIRRHEQIARELDEGFTQASRILQDVRQRIEAWRVQSADDDAWQSIRRGLQRIYRRGRRAFGAVQSPADAETWHTWRRRAKDLRYALELLREAAPHILTGAAAAAKQLTDDLGEEHDLSVLLATVESAPPAVATPENLAALAQAVQLRRDQLQRRAIRHGSALYAESPAAFTRRIGIYWSAVAGAVDAADDSLVA